MILTTDSERADPKTLRYVFFINILQHFHHKLLSGNQRKILVTSGINGLNQMVSPSNLNFPPFQFSPLYPPLPPPVSRRLALRSCCVFYARITLAIGDYVCGCVCDSWPIRKKRIVIRSFLIGQETLTQT